MRGTGTHRTTPPGTALLLALTFCAGFAMMAIEITATRLLAPFFGSTTYLWTNVIAAIMAALAAGYYLGGRLADRQPSGRLAGLLATGAGVLGLALPDAARGLARVLLPGTASDPAAIPATVPASLLVALLVFAPPVFLLGMLNPLLVKLLAFRREVGWAAGANAAASTLGAILGTFSPTLWLVPWIGSRKTVLACVFPVLVLGALLALRAGARKSTAVALLAALAAIALMAGPRRPVLPGPDLVAEDETAYQYVRVERRGEALALTIDGMHGSAQSVLVPGRYLTGGTIYDQLATVPLLLDRPAGTRLDVLVLGFGAGTLARQLVHFYGEHYDLHVDGVEIDPGLLAIGRRHLATAALDPERVRVHVQDARLWLTVTDRTYDLVVLDVFARRALVPFHLVTREFFSLVRAHMRPGGLLAMNFVLPSSDSRLFRCLHRTLADALGHVAWYRVSATMNVVLLASPQAALEPGRGKHALEMLAARGWRKISEAPVLAKLARQGWRHLVLDATVPLVPPLTDDLAPVEVLFLDDVHRSMAGR